MYIDRILYPIETLGPGKRIAVWTAGCSKHCPNCANPELWDIAGKKDVSIGDLAQMLRNICAAQPVDGITFTGGDPLEQAAALLAVLEKIRPVCTDILVYTGYQLADLQLLLSRQQYQQLQQLADVLIDGPYIDEQNDGKCALRGSSNQSIHYFNPSLQPRYEPYLRSGRKIQNIVMGDRFISVGIHDRKKDCNHEEQSTQVATGNFQL